MGNNFPVRKEKRSGPGQVARESQTVGEPINLP